VRVYQRKYTFSGTCKKETRSFQNSKISIKRGELGKIPLESIESLLGRKNVRREERSQEEEGEREPVKKDLPRQKKTILQLRLLWRRS